MIQGFISDESQNTEKKTPLARRRHEEEKNNPTGRFFASITYGIAVSCLLLSTQASAETKLIQRPSQARLFGLESLRKAVKQDGGVPLPKDLEHYVKNREAAIQLGKALFWDMQIGSDGVQSCASCHFHAGADNRVNNQINPGLLAIYDHRDDEINGYFNAAKVFKPVFDNKQPNQSLKREDFPFVKSIQNLNRTANGSILPVPGNSNDIAGSMGMLFTFYNSVIPGFAIDLGSSVKDPIWNINGIANVRRSVPRNAPSVINTVFNYTNFWDGRANPHFNGQDAFGDQSPNGGVVVHLKGQPLDFEPIAMDNASLASQTLDPIVSFAEMSYGDPSQRSLTDPSLPNGRSIPEIGIKMLRPSQQTGKPLTPLGLQSVHTKDSVLGSLSKAPYRGLNTTYETLIKAAFSDQYWDSDELIETPGIIFSQMEYNFGLFFGLSVALYESTLVADQTYFDQWMETGRFNRGFGHKELAGLNLFVNEGQCIKCHAGPELTKASIRAAQGNKNLIRAMEMSQGRALYDNGFYNISVTPTTDDIGRGSADNFGNPLAFVRQALFSREENQTFPFPLLGNTFIPAKDENSSAPVCEDTNSNGFCDDNENILPDFKRVAVDGAFKTPGLRNSFLTGPYFHNGGMATLRQVVQFYNRGGNFCSFNAKDLDPNIQPLGLSEEQEEELVSFLIALTDDRVVFQKAPFDHPELRIPSNGLDTIGTRKIKAVGANGSDHMLKTFLNLDPNDSIFTPIGNCSRE